MNKETSRITGVEESGVANGLGLNPVPCRPSVKGIRLMQRSIEAIATCLLFPYPFPPRIAICLRCFGLHNSEEVESTEAVESKSNSIHRIRKINTAKGKAHAGRNQLRLETMEGQKDTDLHVQHGPLSQIWRSW